MKSTDLRSASFCVFLSHDVDLICVACAEFEMTLRVATTYAERKRKKKKRRKRADDEGKAENITDGARISTAVEPDEPIAKTAERKIYRRGKKRKLRKLNDGGKLEIVPITVRIQILKL